MCYVPLGRHLKIGKLNTCLWPHMIKESDDPKGFIVDSKRRPRCRHLAISTNRSVVFDSAPSPPLCENMTSSIYQKYTTCHTVVKEGQSHEDVKVIVYRSSVVFGTQCTLYPNKKKH